LPAARPDRDTLRRPGGGARRRGVADRRANRRGERCAPRASGQRHPEGVRELAGEG